MRQIIQRHELLDDDVHYAGEQATGATRAVLALADYLASSGGPTPADSVLLQPADEVAQLVPHLPAIRLIVIDFPKIGEGRGFSQARLLRQRYRYANELRARGALKRDQLFFLARCGFDSFQLDPSENLPAALAAMNTFSVAYQDASEALVHVMRRNFHAH